MNTQQDQELDAALRDRLEKLREVPARNAEAAARGRRNYLSTVRRLSVDAAAGNKKFASQAVSASFFQRLNGWINSVFKPPVRRERFSMLVALTTLIVTLVLLFGGAGATVYAAQGSLPSDFLYPFKTLSEDVLLDLNSDPQARFDLLLDFTDRRVDEIVALASEGRTIPEEVVTRLQEQDDAILLLLSGMDESKMPDALLQAQIHKRNQDRDMGKIRARIPENANPMLAQVEEILQEQITLLQSGIDNPAMFPQRVHQRFNSRSVVSPETTQTPALIENEIETETGPGECSDCTPVYSGSGPGPGPGPSNQGATTQPDDGYGPGPGPAQMETPIATPGGDNGQIGPFGPPAVTPVPGEGGPGPMGEVTPPAAPDDSGGGQSGGGGGGKP